MKITKDSIPPSGLWFSPLLWLLFSNLSINKSTTDRIEKLITLRLVDIGGGTTF